MKKLIKTAFFLIHKKWATRSNFESVIRFVAEELEEPDLQHHVKHNFSGNVTMMSPKTVEQIIKIISDKLDTSLLDTLKLCNHFSVLADESTSDKNDSILSIYLRFLDPIEMCVREEFLSHVRLTTSHSSIALCNAIKDVFIEKFLDLTKIRFSGLDGTNSMAGEVAGLQALIRNVAVFSVYVNCRCHRLALVFVHLIKEHPVLSQVDSVLLQVWKIFKFSTVRNAILEEVQIVEGTKPLKMLKAVTTRWLTHGQAAVRVVERYKSIIAACDTIFFERGDCEVKGVHNQLLKKHALLCNAHASVYSRPIEAN